MIKNDYGRLGCPYYQERLENGVYVYFIPRHSKLKSATVYINKGTLLSAPVVNSMKIPQGASYYLANSILSKEIIHDFSKKGVMSKVDVDYSYTAFSLTTFAENSLFSCLEKLMERISTPCVSEEEVNAFRESDQKRMEEEANDPILLSQKRVLDDLYFVSPLAHPVYPNEEEAKNLHASTLRKFQELYYVPQRVVLFISVDDDPRETIKLVKKLRFPKPLTILEEPNKKEEDYTKVKEEYVVIDSDDNSSYLSYGIKFACRHNIFDAYGEAMFFMYENLTKILFEKNHDFISGIADLKSDLVSCRFLQGGEDATILLTFRTDTPEEIVHFMSNYLTKVSKYAKSKLYDQLKEEYYAQAMKTLSSPHLVVDAFARAYPNHISYTSLVAHTMRLSSSVFKHFLEDIRQFRRSACYCKKPEVDHV